MRRYTGLFSGKSENNGHFFYLSRFLLYFIRVRSFFTNTSHMNKRLIFSINGVTLIRNKCNTIFSFFGNRLVLKSEQEGEKIMTTYEATRNRILTLLGQYDLSMNQLAVQAALPPSSIKNIIYGRSSNPTVNTISEICGGFGITLSQFFDDPVFLDAEQEDRPHKKL